MKRKVLRFALLVPCVLTSTLLADEGMWTFDNPPLKQLQERYGFHTYHGMA